MIKLIQKSFSNFSKLKEQSLLTNWTEPSGYSIIYAQDAVYPYSIAQLISIEFDLKTWYVFSKVRWNIFASFQLTPHSLLPQHTVILSLLGRY